MVIFCIIIIISFSTTDTQSFLWLTGLKLDEESWDLSYIGNHSTPKDDFRPESVSLYVSLLLSRSPRHFSSVQSDHKVVSRFWDIFISSLRCYRRYCIYLNVS